jgi:two-component system, OmpR family, phosphate regulon response regulator PhoB
VPAHLDLRPQRILVIEDDELIRETVAQSLRDQGYEVLTARDGREGLDYLLPDRAAPSRVEIDLVILDLMLPVLGGLDICRLVRQQGLTVPILVISAKGGEADRVIGLELGADDYLAKPFGMQELFARCRALLRRAQISPGRSASPPERVLQFQEMLLYPQQHRVLVRGQEVSLSRKEYTLLELFMQNPQRVFSREQLLDRVWGMEFLGDTKTIEVHIRWLREKLEVDPSRPQYLITVRGFGYRLG